eukprot:TRINITY_DN4928_c0_g1_i3.p2 TRINITY_DN4928_c0_g1~~TRINITY_DN4928_c0_g1_i3.p2  ORF type:complete len:280 (+),score=20.80 TRINITY_DN4928_c0_g1_i3:115-840(+)
MFFMIFVISLCALLSYQQQSSEGQVVSARGPGGGCPGAAPFSRPSTTTSQSQDQCTIYDSKISPDFDVYERCRVASQAEYTPGIVACDLQKEIVELLQSCSDKESFDTRFELYARQQIETFQSTDKSLIWGIGVAFEPFTFENLDFYAPYVRNGDVAPDGDFIDLIDIYNYYNECLDVFGPECMWYHIAKEKTYYRGTGGVWLLDRPAVSQGTSGSLRTFFTPIILQGRFYGLVFVDIFIV